MYWCFRESRIIVLKSKDHMKGRLSVHSECITRRGKKWRNGFPRRNQSLCSCIIWQERWGYYCRTVLVVLHLKKKKNPVCTHRVRECELQWQQACGSLMHDKFRKESWKLRVHFPRGLWKASALASKHSFSRSPLPFPCFLSHVSCLCWTLRASSF